MRSADEPGGESQNSATLPVRGIADSAAADVGVP